MAINTVVTVWFILILQVVGMLYQPPKLAQEVKDTVRINQVSTCRMDAVSEHSTMKVDSPAMMRSEAPRRVKIRSATDRRQEEAGT